MIFSANHVTDIDKTKHNYIHDQYNKAKHYITMQESYWHNDICINESRWKRRGGRSWSRPTLQLPRAHTRWIISIKVSTRTISCLQDMWVFVRTMTGLSPQTNRQRRPRSSIKADLTDCLSRLCSDVKRSFASRTATSNWSLVSGLPTQTTKLPYGYT